MWGDGCEKEEDYFLHVLQNLSATSKGNTPRSSKRCLFTLQEQLMVCRTPSRMEECTPANTEILSHFPIYSSNTSFIPPALHESLLETQAVHSTAPLKPALPTHNRILNYRLARSLSAAFLFQETLWCSLQNFATSFKTIHKVWSSLVVGFMSFTDDGVALCHTQHFQAFH